jgi:hypothetical protein
MSDLNSRDLFPTDEIYEWIFEFREQDSWSASFEFMAYEGANFINLTGSLLIVILFMILNAIISILINRCTRMCYLRRWARRLGAAVGSYPLKEGLVRMVFEGYLELVICTLISSLRMEKSDWDGSSWSDTVSLSVCMLTAAVLIIFPSYYLVILITNRH